ncbi:acyltransferase [Microbacterium jejuense]|uniref:Acyltransferase n=1 Tax=Microbacterium jejuense TaxID=1263637 RepID=A0ABS7HLW5_9MICO|nr:acyltransferase [Microbacterium jejuense]MBW9093934.1 acyltransferase [Microbacterium jejuense]
MTVATAAPVASALRPRGRDRAVDLVRAACILGVVVLHAMMVGVAVPDGAPSFVNASDGTWWIVPLSWVFQVMPLFFVIGGFSAATAYRRSRERGSDAVDFVSGRVHRLLRPAIVTIGVVGVLLAVLAAAVPDDLVTLAGFRFAQPLWFLGVFLVCQALVPALLRCHDRAPLTTIGMLAAAAAGVDALRIVSGVEALGFLNLAFVWLALQQLGFFLADGRIDALSRRTRVIAVIAAVAGLAVSFVSGIHSPDLVANINPPTTALLLVGIAHTALFTLLREPIARFAQRPTMQRFTDFVTPRAMTIYLWHMPVLLSLAGLTALWALTTGLPLPAIDGAAWWLTRPAWLVLALAATAAVALIAARVEAEAAPAATRSARRVSLAVVMGMSAVALLLVVGTTVFTAAVAVALLAGALRLARATDPTRVGVGQRIGGSFVDGVQVAAPVAP